MAHRSPVPPLALPLFLLIFLLLFGCSSLEEHRVGGLVEHAPTPAAFRVCHGSNCHIETPVTLTAGDWARVRAQFQPAPATALDELRRISSAVGLMERLVAPQAGTGKDVGRNLAVADQSTQLDCVDEAVNSSTYLHMFADDGLLRFVGVEAPAHRGGVILAHNTAVVRDLATGQRYAVDSWFYDNGAPAVILPLQTWLAGWEPGDSAPTVAANTPTAIQSGAAVP
ncbi:MAG TPA: hypothetical protein VHA10_01040 [Hypericibacter adhaerens]|jgi:hypothetical protein|uniref:Lipoprotein n=1 Tax=Hypericibacter adhaerens TaxID=2602016 RepID=A0A5J6MZD1_9PROT|nr:hypothetical protein [Hypericibacter adhaerens]QEX22507.1 hypothetical protein FRZ61_24390 [Hypericibacter adhaerens]HWA41766.1 hypothetical protein [Hypericibacter adhaerens]